MSELLPFTLPILLLLKRRVKATRWRVLSEVISFWPVWQYPKDPTVNKVFNVFVNCKHFYPKIDISSVNSTQGMMSCHHAGKSIPGCLENRDMISEGHPTSTGISQHSSNDPEYCFPTFKKNWYSCWIKTTLNQDFLKVKEVVITMMLKKKKIIGLQLIKHPLKCKESLISKTWFQLPAHSGEQYYPAHRIFKIFCITRDIDLIKNKNKIHTKE